MAVTPRIATSLFSTSLNPNSTLKPKPFKIQPLKPHLPLFKSLKCIQSNSPLSSSAVVPLPSETADLSLSSKLRHLTEEFRSLPESVARVKRLLHYAGLMLPIDESARLDSNRVMGCTARVWVDVKIDGEGKVRLAADSDSEITKGFCACLVWVLDGLEPDEVLKVTTDDFVALNVGLPGTGRSRINTWHNVLVTLQKKTKQLVAEKEGKVPFEQ